MMRILLLLVALNLFTTAQAQLPNLKKEAGIGGLNAGKLLTQFAGALNPASFTDGWAAQKSGWLQKAGQAANAAGMASSVASLAGFIKPSMFKQGFNLQSLMQTAKTVKTLSSATGLLKNLEGGLKPEAFASGWGQQRSGWLSALNLLK